MRKITLLFMALVAMSSVAGTPVKGVDRNNLDPGTTPGENIYQYACGGWKLNNPLDPQYARFGTFDQLAENSRNQVKDIITNLGTNNPRGSIKQKVGDLYALGMDSVRLNNEGMAPLAAGIEQYKSLKRDRFMAAIGQQHLGIAGPFFNSAVMADLKDSNTNMMYLMQGGLGMGDGHRDRTGQGGDDTRGDTRLQQTLQRGEHGPTQGRLSQHQLGTVFRSL